MDVTGSNLEVLEEGEVVVVGMVPAEALVVFGDVAPHLAFAVGVTSFGERCMFGAAPEKVLTYVNNKVHKDVFLKFILMQRVFFSPRATYSIYACTVTDRS